MAPWCLCRSNVCAMTVFALLASLLHRLFVMNKVRLWEMIPVPFYGPYPGDSLARMHYMWSATYLSLISHATPLCLGILAYMALSSTITNTLLTRYIWVVLSMLMLYIPCLRAWNNGCNANMLYLLDALEVLLYKLATSRNPNVYLCILQLRIAPKLVFNNSFGALNKDESTRCVNT